MNLNEAYETLGLSPDASKEEVSKAFKKLAALHHPDSSKEPDEDKFKKINEAKRIIDNPPPESPFNDFMGSPGWGRVHINMGSQRRSRPTHPDPVIHVNMTFFESVTGIIKKISYERYVKCISCDGEGIIIGSKTCDKCNGQGHGVQNQGHVRILTECGKCRGTGREVSNCMECNGEGVKKESVTSEIRFPYPIEDGQTIRAPNSGNYRGTSNSIFGGHHEIFGDMRVIVHVDPDPDMSIDESGENILSTIKLKLIDALKGTTKKVRTLKGDLSLKIPPASKNGQSIIAKKYGPGYIGNHIFLLDVEYPEDLSELIELLEKQEK